MSDFLRRTIASPRPHEPKKRAWPGATAALLAVAGWLLFSTPTLADAAASVTGIRFGAEAHRTRVVLDVSERLPFEARLLDGGQGRAGRLILDLPLVSWRLGAGDFTKPRGLAKDFRYGRLDERHSRLVVDLKPSTGSTRVLDRRWLPPNGQIDHWRLVVDLGGATSPAAVVAANAAEPSHLFAPSPPAPRPARRSAVAEAAAFLTLTPAPRPTVEPAAAPSLAIAVVEEPEATPAPAAPRVVPLPPLAQDVRDPSPGQDGSAAKGSAGGTGDGLPDEIAQALAALSPGVIKEVAPSLRGTDRAKPPAPPQPVWGPRRPVIALDPGHGGRDPGAVGYGGVREKDLTLAFAQELRRVLERSGNFEVFLTREGDSFVPLRERIARAREAEADLFVSLHADSLPSEHGVRGASVYTLSEDASDAEAARLAAKENRADIIGGADLSGEDDVVAEILIDLAQRDTNNRSIDFAEMLIGEVRGVSRVIRRSRRFADFAVLKSPDVPSVLIELGYLSNPDDAKALQDEGYRARLIEAMSGAIEAYFAEMRRVL